MHFQVAAERRIWKHGRIPCFFIFFLLTIIVIFFYSGIEFSGVKFAFAFNEGHKLSSGSFYLGNGLLEFREKDRIPPRVSNRIDTYKRSMNLAAISVGSLIKSFFLFMFAGEDAAEQSGNQNREDDETEFFKYIHFFVVPMCCVYLFFYIFFLHNV